MKKLIIFLLVILSLTASFLFSVPEENKNEVYAQQIVIQIDASKEIRPMSPQMRGSTLGIWTNSHYYPTANPKLVNMLSEAGMKIMRYPAGAEADDTMFDRNNSGTWYTGTAPYSRRMRADHLDAFISLCRQIGAQPLIVVNAKIDNPDMAADIVRYCNIEHDYNVKNFEIGNEPIYWKNVTVAQYADRVARYSDAMKAVDPSIIIHSSAGPQPTTIDSWLTPVMETAGDKIDAVTIHWYPLWDGATSPSHPQYPSIPHLLYYDYGPSGNQQGAIMFSKRFVLTNSDSLTNLRDRYSPGASIGITELSPVAGGNSASGVSDTMGNALWYGDILGRLAYYGVDFTNQFLAISEPQKYAMSDYKYNIRPSWYTFVMYNRYFGDMLVESESDLDSELTAWASTKNGENGKLYLLVVNKNLSSDLEAVVNISGFAPAPTAKKWTLSSVAYNSLTASINGVSYSGDATLPAISPVIISDAGNSFFHTFPAHSITAIELAASGGPVPTPTVSPSPTPSPTAAPSSSSSLSSSFISSTSSLVSSAAPSSSLSSSSIQEPEPEPTDTPAVSVIVSDSSSNAFSEEISNTSDGSAVASSVSPEENEQQDEASGANLPIWLIWPASFVIAASLLTILWTLRKN